MKTSERYQKVSEIFLAACELEGEARAAYLDQACSGDGELRAQVDALLRRDDESNAFLRELPRAEVAKRLVGAGGADALLGTVIGPYRIERCLGQGGMGAVYLAEQTLPIHRSVALKIIKLGMDTRQVIARFEAEREALSLMNHPNVAKVLDAGATESGRPYFVMEFVEGVPITTYCDEHRLSTTERLRLFMDVCAAVQHAHQKGIIHRDIKPSNVLVTEVDGKPVPKVIDFGIAKATQQRAAEETYFTETGQLIGTPGYMSPEQAGGNPADIDTRTDVYSLGVLLYELLVGVGPFDEAALRQAGFAEIQRIIREVDPPKPSTRLSSLAGTSTTVAEHRKTSFAALAKELRGDLDWVVMKCLDKDRTRRYDTANALVMELHRYLNNEPVTAGPPSRVYRLTKFVRRNRGAVSAVTTVVLVLVGGLVGTSVMFVRAHAAEERERTERLRAEEGETFAEKARAEAEQSRDEAEQVTQFLSDTLAAADPSDQGRDVTVREVLDRADQSVSQRFANRPLIEGRLRQTLAKTYHGLGLYDRVEANAAEAAAIYQRMFGDKDRRTLAAKNNLAAALQVRGRLSAGEAGFRSNIEIQRRVLGEEHPETLSSRLNLASTLRQQGRYPEAENMAREVLEVRKRVLGEEHIDTICTMGSLANVLYAEGRYSEAEQLQRQALAMCRRTLGDEHPETLDATSDLALTLSDVAQFTESEQLQVAVIEARRRVLGSQHPDTVRAMINYGNSLARQRKCAAAEMVFREAFDIQKEAAATPESDRLVLLNNLAGVIAEQGHFADAEKLIRAGLESFRRAYGDEHPSTLALQSNLAGVLAEQRRFSAAEELFRQVLGIRRRRLGEQHPDTLAAMHNLASVCVSQGRPEEGEMLFRGALASRQGLLGTDHPDTLSSMWSLAGALVAQGRYDLAEPFARECFTICARHLPAASVSCITAGGVLVQSLTGLGRYMEAQEILTEVNSNVANHEILPLRVRTGLCECVIKLYDAWDAAEPDRGYAEKAAHWREALEQLQQGEAERPDGGS